MIPTDREIELEKIQRRERSEKIAAWLRENDVLESTRLNGQLQVSLKNNCDDISDTLLVAVKSKLWERGVGVWSDIPDRRKVLHWDSMQAWVEDQQGLNMTMPQLYRAVANKRMEDTAIDATLALVDHTPKSTLEVVAYSAPSGDLLSAPVPGWLDIAAANEQAYGPTWAKVRDAIDDRLHQKPGGNGNNQYTQPDEEDGAIPVGNRNSTEVSSKSREGRRRTLKRYADDADLCAEKGIEQAAVQQALRALEEGQTSATGAMRACGLMTASDASTNRVFLVRDSQEVARRLIAAAGHDRAAEIAAALNHLLTENA